MGGIPAKSALGRGLRRLMRGPGEPADNNGSSATSGSISPGVARLLRGLEQPEENNNLVAEAPPSSIAGSLETTVSPATIPASASDAAPTTTAIVPLATTADPRNAAAPKEALAENAPVQKLSLRGSTAPLPTFGANEVVAWRRLVQASLIGADVLLVGIAGWLAFSPSHRFGLVGGLVCVVAVLAGCWLAALALFLEP